MGTDVRALDVLVRGVVQGVGFRPFVFRTARARGLTGWVLNGEGGVAIHLEGSEAALDAFLRDLRTHPPAAARVDSIRAEAVPPDGYPDFTIRESHAAGPPTVRISPDLAVCPTCQHDLNDPSNPRFHYPYVNCTECGPRYSIILDLPYDRSRTTMRGWPMCDRCAAEYADPGDRRFHAQPVACPRCGPGYWLRIEGVESARGEAAIRETARRLRGGQILAIKGLGGYHLACDARNPSAVQTLRERKVRQAKPFALMARDLETARTLAGLTPEAEGLLTSVARPIVLAPARIDLAGVAPDNRDVGIMLPYTPLHHLLFAYDAPDVLVMTSANRSDEPIAYDDADAFERLDGLADAFTVGERPIARRVDDSVARDGPFGPTILRRARGYAPGIVTTLPTTRPILAVGADLKNTVTLVVRGGAAVSQHLGDLAHYPAFVAFQETIQDLCRMYAVRREDLLVVHDAHPEYVSTGYAAELSDSLHAVQHHRAHLASVLAEQGAWDTRVVGVVFDGTGYGDDRSIWGGELFVGSVKDGFARAAHLRPAVLPGGDAAARFPVQAAAGFLAQIPNLPDLHAPPFNFPDRFRQASRLVANNLRAFPTTSVGRLFDTVAALLGFTAGIAFEGQAAIWLEHRARHAPPVAPYPFELADGGLDFRPLLTAIIADRRRGRDSSEVARAFHEAMARAVVQTSVRLAHATTARRVVLSGGVFQNLLLLERVRSGFETYPNLEVWTNHAVPPNDGGISLGQAALGAFVHDSV